MVLLIRLEDKNDRFSVSSYPLSEFVLSVEAACFTAATTGRTILASQRINKLDARLGIIALG